MTPQPTAIVFARFLKPPHVIIRTLPNSMPTAKTASLPGKASFRFSWASRERVL
jgi:hypothetical protein